MRAKSARLCPSSARRSAGRSRSPSEQASLTEMESTAWSWMRRYHVLAADTDDGGDAGANEFGGAVVGHRLDLARPVRAALDRLSP